MWYVLLFQGNNSYANAPQFYDYAYIACFVVYKIFLSSLTLCNTSSLFTRSVQQAFFINLHHHIRNFQGIADVRLLSVVSTFQQYSVLNFNNLQSVVMEITMPIGTRPPPDLFQQLTPVHTHTHTHTLLLYDAITLASKSRSPKWVLSSGTPTTILGSLLTSLMRSIFASRSSHLDSITLILCDLRLQQLDYWHCGFESCWGHGGSSLVCVV